MQEALPIWFHHHVAFFSAKDFFVEVKGGHSVADDQMRNELIFSIHLCFPLFLRWPAANSLTSGASSTNLIMRSNLNPIFLSSLSEAAFSGEVIARICVRPSA